MLHYNYGIVVNTFSPISIFKGEKNAIHKK